MNLLVPELIPFGTIPDFISKITATNVLPNKPNAHIKANTDLDAIKSWLNEYKTIWLL